MNLHPRVFYSQELATRGHSAAIDPTKYTASTLIAQIADGWLLYTQNTDNSAGTIINRASMIRSLARFLTDPNDRHLTLETASPDLPRRLLDWEKDLITQHGPQSERSKKAPATLRQYVNSYLVEKSIDNPLAQRWATSKGLRHGNNSARSTPLDEFSNKERIAIEQKLRDIVRAGERLQEIGNTLLTQGRDPRHAGWDKISNLVWAFHHIALDDIPKTVWQPHLPDHWWSVLEDLIPETAQLKENIFGHPLMGLVIPNLLHLQALRSLFLLRTGWTPEEVMHLKDADVDFDDTVVRVSTTKNRASTLRHRELSSLAREGTQGWNPGDLLRRAEKVMKPAKQQATNNTDFWLGALSLPRSNRRSKSLPAWLSTLPASPHYNLGQLVKRSGLTLSEPVDTRRLRKTHKSAKAVLLGTLAGSAGNDHSIEVFRTHYAQSTTVHTIAAKTVLNAQALVMGNIGPTVVLHSAAQTAKLHHNNQLGSVANTTVQESPIDATLSVSSCVDPTNPPHTSAPQCLDAPQMCLNCANAVIFEDHVPRLVAYRQILKDLEPEMAPQQFAALYGQQIVNIDSVLNQFPVDVVTEAKSNPSSIRVPLTMRKGR